MISGIYLVKSLSKIAKFFHISDFTAAFIIMGIATSIPELFVGISSALQGEPALSVGNVIGSNILDLTLVTGIFVVLARGIKLNTRKIKRDFVIMLLSIILIIVLYLIGSGFSKIDGMILILFFIVCSYIILRKRKIKDITIIHQNKKRQAKEHKIKIKKYFFIFVIALIVLFFASHFIVKYSVLLAIDLKMPEIFIGLFLISIATVLPELVFGIDAVMLKHESMSIGDQAGSTFIKMSLILGLVILLSPSIVTTKVSPFFVSAIFMFISALIFSLFARSDKEMDLREGILLILVYVSFIIIEFFLR